MAQSHWIASCCCLMATILFSSIGNAQTLSKVREEVRNSAPATPSKPERESRKKRKDRKKKESASFFVIGSDADSDSDCDESDDDLSLSASLVTGLLKAPFVIPRAMAQDEGMEAGYFPRYPYLHGSEGFLHEHIGTERGTDAFLLRVRAEYSDDFDSLSYWGGSVLLDTSSRLGFDSEFFGRREDLGSGTDSLWNGDANVVFRFAQSEGTQMRTGIGFNWLNDSFGTDFGFNFTYSGDWFPADPWILSAELDYGTLGSAELLHLRSTLGAQFHRFEAYSGYDYFEVGDGKIHGPVFGIRLWF